jgi:hypothetical protein
MTPPPLSDMTIEAREYVLGGETKKRSLFGVIGGWKGFAVAVGVVAVYIWVQAVTKSWIPLLVLLVLFAAVMLAGIARTAAGDSWASGVRDRWRMRLLGKRADVFVPGFDPATGLPAVPSEVGVIEQFVVPVPNGNQRIAVIGHGGQVPYWSTVVEVVGGGDGIVEAAVTNARGQDFEGLLFACSRANFPVDQIDVASRVTLGGRAEYLKWLADRSGHAGEALAESALEVAEEVTLNAENYRSWMVVSMPDSAITAVLARAGVKPTKEAKAYQVARTTFEVCRLARRRGLRPVRVLSPEQLGGLIRHLYVPSIEADDVDDVAGVREGFQPYESHRGSYFRTSGSDGSTWYHATASVPRDGWPLQAVDGRVLESLVTDVSPATIRTVVAQHRLVPRVAARKDAIKDKTLDEADILANENRGRISTGEAEAQSASASRLLHDLLYGQAAGDRPALRVTVSAEDPAQLAAARERLDSAAQDAGFNRLLWHETRHHHGHLLTLPLGRGITRSKTASGDLGSAAISTKGRLGNIIDGFKNAKQEEE